MLRERSSGSVKILSVDYEALLEALKGAGARIRGRHPGVKRVLLFGSFAAGNYTPESDIDILIVVKDTAVPFLKRQDDFLDFFTGLPFDVNMLVYTEGELEKMLREKNALITEAAAGAVEL